MFSLTLTTKAMTTALTASWSSCALFGGRQDQSIEAYAPSKRAHAVNPEGA